MSREESCHRDTIPLGVGRIPLWLLRTAKKIRQSDKFLEICYTNKNYQIKGIRLWLN